MPWPRLRGEAQLWWREEWREGTALFYYLSDPTYGLSHSGKILLGPVLSLPGAVRLSTWAVVLVEGILVLAFFARGRLQSFARVLGLGMHLMIALFLGLPTFSMTMISGLLLYLAPLHVVAGHHDYDSPLAPGTFIPLKARLRGTPG